MSLSKSGRSRIKYGMTPCLNNYKKSSGFTLIELLVVVLIIGILAAVAVPQYQKAIDKSRLMTLIPLVKAVADAKSAHYMATGEWARTFDVLSVSLPPQCHIYDQDYYGQGADQCFKRTVIYLDSGSNEVAANFFLSGSNQFIWYYITPGEKGFHHTCNGYGNRAAALCASLPGATFVRQTDNATSYRIN